MTLRPLRPYQAQAIAACRDSLRAGKRAPLLVAPTGAGKTRIGVEIVLGAIARGGRVLWMAHRAELIDQAVASICAEGIDLQTVTTLRAGRRGYVPSRPVCVASTQTLLGLLDQADSLEAIAPTIMVLDEAHHYVADEWKRIGQAFASRQRGDSCRLVGLTATPERGDGRPLGDMFDDLIVVATVAELTALGTLVPCEIIHPDRKLKKGARVRAADPLDAYEEHARGSKAVVFVTSVDESARVAAAFTAAGYPAASVVGTTPPGERRAAIERFRAGELCALVNMQVLTEGFDAPDVETVILGMKCGSTGNYLQKVGRGLRSAPGKTRCLVIDLAGAATKHGHPADHYEYSLDGDVGIRGAPRVVAAKQCATCGACFRASVRVCPGCGAEAVRTMDVEIDPARLVAFPVSTREEKQAMYNEWQRTAKSQGYRDGWVAHQFRRKFGVWPRGMADESGDVVLPSERVFGPSVASSYADRVGMDGIDLGDGVTL